MTKLQLARVIRLVIALGLLVVIAVILWYFISHRRPLSVVPLKTEDIPAEKVERQEGVEHFDFKGERVIRAKAERHYAGQDGRYYLEGNVEIRDLGKEKGEEIVLHGDRVSYDKDWGEVLLEGKAKLQYEGLTVESPAFSYLKKQEYLTTDQGVVFASRTVSGKAQKMAYSFKAASVLLEGAVEMEFREETEARTPLLVRGDTVTFLRKKRKGEVAGNVSFSFDRSRGQADTLRFDLTPDEQSVRAFYLKGNVRVAVVERPEPAPAESRTADLERDVSAEEVIIRAFKNRQQISQVEARNGCLMKSSSPEGQTTEVASERMTMGFDRRGILREFLAGGGARLVERSPSADILRSVSGEQILIGAQGRTWRIRAPEGGEARVDSPDSDVTAQSFVISQQRESLAASGSVKVIVKFRPEAEGSVGFFSNEQPVLGAAERMRFEGSIDRLELTEGVRMWQGNDALYADRVTVLKKTGEIAAEGKVRTVFSRPSEGEAQGEEKVEIGGDKLGFNPAENRLDFEPGGWLKSKELALNSDRISVALKEKTSVIQQIEARGKVNIIEELREGKGEQAVYDLSQKTIVLTGSPTVIDKEKGVIKGEKLTFRLGEGRIQVENKDRERSTTVIKS
jgi:lipopolysaccharide transport protein LptA